MVIKTLWSRLALVLAGLASSCVQTPQAMRYDIDKIDTQILLPAASTMELPRYRLIGQLFGAPNVADAASRGRVSTALRWIVGIDERATEPNVLRRPQSGLVDAQKRILVTDVSRQAILVFDETAARIDVWDRATAKTAFVAPIAIAAGDNGQIFVTDAELKRVFRIGSKGEPLGEFGAGLLKRPTGIVRDAVLRQLFVADTYAHDIKVFSDDGHLLRTIGKPGDQTGEFSYPTHLALSAGKLYVTDTMNARIQIFDTSGTTLMQIGQRGLYLGNLVRPKGVAVDSEGNVYVVESYHDHVLVFDRSGRFLMAMGGTGKENSEFYLPAGVWIDAKDRVFVADMFNGRVVIFQFLGGTL